MRVFFCLLMAFLMVVTSLIQIRKSVRGFMKYRSHKTSLNLQEFIGNVSLSMIFVTGIIVYVSLLIV